MQTKKAIFLDRDGVINKDFNYVHLKEDFEFIDGVFEGVRFYQSNGYLPIVITNQSGIARGYYTTEQFHTLTEWMLECFVAQGIHIGKVYFCPHDSTENCLCRKPMPGMIQDAQKLFDLDLSKSVLVGDKESDIVAGRNAGVGKCFLVANEQPKATDANFVVKSLFDTIEFLKKGEL